MKRQFSTALALSLVAAIHLGAADFDVTNSVNFQTALTIAQSNGEADTINVTEGTYHISSTLTYESTSEENYSLTIQGEGAASTILDGGDSVQIMNIIDSGRELSTDITIRGMTFQKGSGSDGGGLFVNTGDASIIIEDSNFSKNYASGDGGGVRAWAKGTVTLTNNTFSENSTEGSGGGADVETDVNYSPIILTNNMFYNNSAKDGGGGVTAASRWEGGVTLTSNTFSENSTEGFGGGARTSCWDSTTTLTSNVFSNNFAKGNGGGAYATGYYVKLTNNIFNKNSTEGNSGGVYASAYDYPGGARLTNNTFYDNSAYTFGGGAFVSMDAGVTIDIFNNIIWNNTASAGGDDGDDLYVANSSVYYQEYNVEFYNNDLGSDANFTSGQSEDLYITRPEYYVAAGNLKDDPQFVDALSGDFHLSDSSPLIDEGNDTAPALPATDFEGDARPIDGNGDGIPVPDIGADEYVPVSITYILEFFDKAVEDGDIEGDGPGNSAENRLKAFRKMLLEAQLLIEAGDITDACDQLNSIDIHCDGLSRPNDFIGGVAVSELNSMILELKASLGCEEA